MADESQPQPLDYRAPSPAQIKLLEDAESRRWRYRRTLFRIGLFVLLAPVTFYFGPNVFKFGKLTRLAPADFVTSVERFGVPSVRAIKEYQRDTGHFPNQMQDLVPKYLPSIPGFGGDIENGQFVMWGNLEHMITYHFTAGAEGWTVSGAFANGTIPLSPVTIGPATQPTLTAK
jgi:hypothetical protein